jgi:hypothetical protein
MRETEPEAIACPALLTESQNSSRAPPPALAIGTNDEGITAGIEQGPSVWRRPAGVPEKLSPIQTPLARIALNTISGML